SVLLPAAGAERHVVFSGGHRRHAGLESQPAGGRHLELRDRARLQAVQPVLHRPAGGGAAGDPASRAALNPVDAARVWWFAGAGGGHRAAVSALEPGRVLRSEERRVGKEWRSWGGGEGGEKMSRR